MFSGSFHAPSPVDLVGDLLGVAPKDVTFPPDGERSSSSPVPPFMMDLNEGMAWPHGPTDTSEFAELGDLGSLIQSQPSSAYSGSPAQSDVSLPVAAQHQHGGPLDMGLLEGQQSVLGGLFDGAFGSGMEMDGGVGVPLGFEYAPHEF